MGHKNTQWLDILYWTYATLAQSVEHSHGKGEVVGSNPTGGSAMPENLYLTKTDFVHFLRCPRSLWLLKHKPEVYPYKEFSDFLKKIMREGYEVEGYAQQLFPGGVSMPLVGDAAVAKTKEALADGVEALFQATILTDKGLFARADILERNKDGTYTLYEVKSSNDPKKSKEKDKKKEERHLKDACFQKIAFEQAEVTISAVYIIYTNRKYVRDIKVNPQQLLEKVNITEVIQKMYDETEIEINNAVALLKETKVHEEGCHCFRKTQSNHCDAFEYFNGALEEHAIWEIGNIREKRLCAFLDHGIEKIEDIKGEVDLNEKQQRQVQSVLQGRPIINEERIKEMLNELVFPLYFFDYEAAASAVPKIIGTRPWQHIPFQYSLHILHTDDTLTHAEHIHETLSAPEGVVQAVCEAIGDTGSVISWHMSYEKMINKEMIEMYPTYREKLKDINEQMFDLENIFKEAYVDAQFCGSTSIKKILPVLCPQLSYKGMAVQDGAQAMEQWFMMVDKETDKETHTKIKNDLLAYCKLDTFAMVEIYRTIKNIVK